MVLEAAVNQDGIDLFQFLRENAKHVHKVHGLLKSRSTPQQVQEILGEVLEGDDEPAREAKYEAYRRNERVELQKMAYELQESDVPSSQVNIDRSIWTRNSYMHANLL